MNGGFKADPEGLVARGERIRNIYNNYVHEKNKISNTTNKISLAWKDSASNMYIATIHSYEGEFRQLGAVIAQLGDLIAGQGKRLNRSLNDLEAIAKNLFNNN